MPTFSPQRIVIVLLTVFVLPDNSQAASLEAQTLATVQGVPITQDDVDRLMASRLVPPAARSKLQKQFLNQLVDRQLVQNYLAKLKVVVDPKIIAARIQSIHARIKKSGDDPKKVLAKLGYTEDSFRKELTLPLAWQLHVKQIISRMELKQLFAAERARYDGTELRARQIVLKLPANENARQLAMTKLTVIRNKIVSGKISFEAAAKKHSTSPSRDKGGDVGFFAYRGRMPVSITKIAFGLKKSDVSKPFVTRFGVHLLQVTGRKPGQLSLEDARPEIFKRLSDERWKSTISRLRKTAKIEWSNTTKK